MEEHDGGATTIVIADNSDLILDVSSPQSPSKKVFFEVRSTALITASKVFNNMLGPESQFAERALLVDCTDRGDVLVVELEDDPEILSIVLKVVHQDCDVPEEVNFNDMVALASIADKYDLVDALKPYIEEWVSVGHFDIKEICQVSFELGWFFVSWVFKLGCLVSMGNHLAETAYVDIHDNFRFRDIYGQPTNELDGRIPSSFLGT